MSDDNYSFLGWLTSDDIGYEIRTLRRPYEQLTICSDVLIDVFSQLFEQKCLFTVAILFSASVTLFFSRVKLLQLDLFPIFTLYSVSYPSVFSISSDSDFVLLQLRAL